MPDEPSRVPIERTIRNSCPVIRSEVVAEKNPISLISPSCHSNMDLYSWCNVTLSGER